MGKLKSIIKNVKVLILLVCLILALVAIYPNPTNSGAAIRFVEKNSSASIAGIQNPKPTTPPMSREVVVAINNKPIETVAEYYNMVSEFRPNVTVQIKTNKGLYRLLTKEDIEIIELNETIDKIVNEIIQVNETINGTVVQVNKTITKTIQVPKTQKISHGLEDIGLNVYDAPKTNLRKGLDLQGGTRVLLQPEEEINSETMEFLLDNMKERLNVYGLSDIVVRESGDLSGNQYILVEIAGANEKEVKELLAKQGKFEAKIGNNTVFMGGTDITYVCKSSECSGISPTQGCSQVSDGWACRFRFSISLRPDAAQRQADYTSELDVVNEGGGQYLEKPLDLFLDDSLVDSLNIGASLKGSTTTEIAISGSGTGTTKDEAIFNSLANMKRLQTILITGSLPIKLNIVQTDSVSPLLGKEFLSNAIMIGLIALLSVTIIIYFVYRKYQIVLPIVFTLISEVVLLLGVASLIGWNLDLAAIAGIIIAVGTGVDHLIIITDETLKGSGKTAEIYDWKRRIKGAFFIIMAAFFTTFVAMLPLLFAGAGLLKGFALITIIGTSIGVFIARPAFAAVIEIVLKE